MPSVRNIRPRYAVLTALLLVATAVQAAQLRTSRHAEFDRISLDFGTPVSMQMSQGGGEATVSFSEPLKTDASVIARQLGPHVRAATIAADGKTLRLVFDKPYRVRRFISGDVVGLDILTGRALEPTTQEMLSTKPVAEEKPAAKPKEAPKKPAAKVATAEADMLTTKKPVPAPEKAKAKPKKEQKPAEPAGEMLTTKQPEPEPAKKPDTATHQAAPVEKVEPTPPPAPAATETIEPEQAAAENMPAPQPDKPFIVSVKNNKDSSVVNFPFGERTAAAMFERSGEIWVVFSREKDLKTKLLASTLPKEVLRTEQFRLPGATVLRLTTDGSLHPTASQPQGGYEWNLTLSTHAAPAAQEIPVSGESQDGKRYLEIGALDTAPPLRFYDPKTQDLLLVVPAYEAGRGVTAARHYPEIDLLATPQGVAIASRRDDLATEQTRSGLRLSGGNKPLAISDDLPLFNPKAAPTPGTSNAADVLLPYDRWFVATADFNNQRAARLNAVATATPAQKADSILSLAELYMGQGMAVEALGYLSRLQTQYSDFYAQRKLAVMTAAANVMIGRLSDATQALAAPELEGVPEAQMWRQFLATIQPIRADEVQQLQKETEAQTDARQAAAAQEAVQQAGPPPEAAAPAPPPPPAPKTFPFLDYNKPYIRFYPPRLRQRMAVLSADLYLADNQADTALKIYDTLGRDGILGPVEKQAEFTLAAAGQAKDKVPEALAIYDRLSKQYDDPYIQTRASFAGTMLRFAKGMQDANATIAQLESLRLGWRGDTLQRQILIALADLYQDNKRYDDLLRTWQYLIDTFPNDPEILSISGRMAELFQKLFLDGLADDMPPLKSLALFYEFRNLTPVGDTGNLMIQKLADRLAAVDLIDRATQLLDNQVKSHLGGEDRARVGARLALLYLLNHQPQEALNTLDTTSYGEATPELRRQRTQLTAQALSDTGKHEEALSLLFSDDSGQAALLKLDILWAMKDWPNVVNTAEDILSARPNLTATLTPGETEILMKLALGYIFEGDNTQLAYLRDYYGALVPEGNYKEAFTFLTNDTAPLDPEDFQLVAKQISNTESFLDNFRKQIHEGGLSETVK